MNSSEVRDLSLIVPCYNEAGYLEESVLKIERILSNSHLKAEIVFVDDMSEDGTREIVDRLVAENSNYSKVFHTRNLGRGKAVQSGVEVSKGEIVGFVDIDLEVSAEYIPEVVRIAQQSEADVVTGCRRIVFSWSLYPLLRLVLSYGYRWLYQLVLSIPIKDPETGFKFFKKNALKKVLVYAQNPGWFWDTEVMAYTYLLGLKLIEHPVVFLRRNDKKSSIRVLSYTIRQFRELMGFRRKLRHWDPEKMGGADS
jgi:dolichol-phosphate mannosyltransferase